MPDIAPQITHLLPQRNEQVPHVGPAEDGRAERDGRGLDRAAERGAHDDGDGVRVREGVLEAEALGFAAFGEEGVADLVGGLAGERRLVGVVKKGRGEGGGGFVRFEFLRCSGLRRGGRGR